MTTSIPLDQKTIYITIICPRTATLESTHERIFRPSFLVAQLIRQQRDYLSAIPTAARLAII